MLVFFLRPGRYFLSVQDYCAFSGKRIVTTERAEDLNVRAAKRLQGWGGQRTGIKIPQWEAGALSIRGLRRAAEQIGQRPQAAFQSLWESHKAKGRI